MNSKEHRERKLHRVIKKAIFIYYKVAILLSKEGGWRKEWRCRKRDFLLDSATFKKNIETFNKRYIREGFEKKKQRKYRKNYFLCLLFLMLTADEYFQYDFINKNWMWRNHHITAKRREFIASLLNPDLQKYMQKIIICGKL